jgi:hypothetical protein
MKRKLFEKVLNTISPKSVIINYDVIKKFQLSESGEWVFDTPAIFVSVTHEPNQSLYDLMSDLELYTGTEVNIDYPNCKILNEKT